MTRLAIEYDAINLSQGMPNEPPPNSLKLALCQSVLSGKAGMGEEITEETLREQISSVVGDSGDVVNQYSPPMGRPDVRRAVSNHYRRLYAFDVDPEQVTITLGATEAMASALRTIGKPGDKIVIFEPFHELYPNQCGLFFLDPAYVTIKFQEGAGWQYDRAELRSCLQGARALILNTPHNPTGKVFSNEELSEIVSWCEEFNVFIITDEIYEHMIYNGQKHVFLPKEFPQIKSRVFICNSIGKSASATGWRLGWCIHPPGFTETYRSVHEQLAVMSPHPMQVACLTYFNFPDEYFGSHLQTKYVGRVRKLAKTLSEVGFHVEEPDGAYYLFARYRSVAALSKMPTVEAALYMVKEVGVACVPGTAFYGKASDGELYLRFSACRSANDIDEGCRRLKTRLLT